MTATAGRAAGRSAEAAAPGSDGLCGTGTLVRFMLRRDRLKLPAWAGGLALYYLYVTTALSTVLGGEDELEGVVSFYAEPVGRLLTGPGYGFDDPTFENVVANGYGMYPLVLAALMSILLVTRHTRGEEQSGRAELVRSSVVGRHAPQVATLVVAAVTNLAAGAAVLAVLAGVAGYGWEGSLLVAAGMVAVGMAFAGLRTVTAQLTAYSRAAAGMAGAGLGAAFVVRAGGDVASEGGSALSWASPLGWAQQTAPFVLDRWWPLALLVGAAVVTTAGGLALSTRRDLGAGLVAARPGSPTAAPWLGTPPGLAFRLQRASLIVWTAGLAATGLVYGAFADAVLESADDLPEAFFDLFGREDVLAGYLGYMAMFMAFFVSVAAVLAVQGLRTEETSGRLDAVLATPLSRAGWLGANLAVAAAAAVVVTTVCGAATGVGAAVVTGDASHVAELTAAHLNHLPAVLAALGVAALLYGAAPRALGAAWAVVGYSFLVDTFGPLLDLPQVAFDLSLFGHIPQMPLEGFDPVPLAVLGAVAVAAGAGGLWAFGRRSIAVR